ncbi:MAG TPA: TetR/AcrR family transcriptional regulator, partial [Streptosporangiaceae bacterium]|nr:TetR/AcrR family transcriptional regulator [Streptosporangiaceae bacterium]
MAVKEAGAARPSARERLLAAANELIYNEGVHTVGIDRIIEQAGVAKASLYNTFGSKDELVRAYLEMRHASVTERIMQAVERYDTPRERLLAVSLGSAAVFFAGSAIAGAGFGSGFQGGIRTVVPLAAAHQRAGLVSLLYVVSYL